MFQFFREYEKAEALQPQDTIRNRELTYRTKDGRLIPMSFNAGLLTDEAGNVTGVVAVAKDLTEIKQAEEKIKESLKEKEVLLKEIHHRVKNNLQVISSLVDMGSMGAKNQEQIDLFTDVRTRIHTMALIHSHLYKTVRFEKVDMGNYIQELVNYMSQVFATENKIVTNVIEYSKVYLSLTQAIPCALS